MKVLQIIETLGTGGAETLLLTIARELKNQGDDVLVAVLRPPLHLRADLEAVGIPVAVFPTHHKWNLLAGMRKATCAARGCDVIHAHLFFPTLYVALARLLGLTHARTCVTFHNLAYRPGVNRAGVGLSMRRLLERLIYPRGIDRFIAVSRAVAAHYGEALGLTGIRILHNPVRLSEFDDILAENPAVGRRHILVPGRLVHEKGHLPFLESLALLRGRGNRFSATLAGDGPFRRAVEDRIPSLGLSEIVTVTGRLEHTALMRLMASAEIVVVPSRFEGFGLTALEAQCLGRPVVATTAGGLPEIVEHGVSGLLVPPGNPVALADALERLLDDPGLRERLGASGRSRAASFAVAPAVRRLREIYRELAPADELASDRP